ncbi:MAG: PDZ domain-containing protein [bacterium]
MEYSRTRLAVIFALGIMIATSASVGILFVSRGAFAAPGAPAQITIVGNQPKETEATRLGYVRDRVLKAVFAFSKKPIAGVANQNIRAAIGLTSDGYVLTTLPVSVDMILEIPELDAPVSVIEIFKDEKLGLAIVKVNATHLPVAKFGESTFIEPGTDAYAVSPMKIEHTVIAGTTFADERKIVGANELLRRLIVPAKTIMVGSAIADGESVLGIVVDVEHGLAMPSDAFMPMVSRFLKLKQILHPVLGIDVESGKRSALVKVIRKASAAEKAGLRIGDVILSVEGEMIQPTHSLAEIIEPFEPSASVELLVRRGQEEKKISVILSENIKK